jgi:hypothetical protein
MLIAKPTSTRKSSQFRSLGLIQCPVYEIEREYAGKTQLAGLALRPSAQQAEALIDNRAAKSDRARARW